MRPSLSALLAVPFVLALSSVAFAKDATWVRYPSISPDGSRIAFAYRGDLWTVPVAGGDAARLTSHEGYEYRAVWSPDGSQIAFAADWYGNFDVFVVSSAGGSATRLTFHSATDIPATFERDGSRILFESPRQDDPKSILGTPRFAELWSIAVAGGRPRLELTTPAERVQLSGDGSVALYQNLRGYEDPWRKHHTSPVARDVWRWERTTGRHQALTQHAAEDRNPVFTPGGDAYLFLSERGSTFNVWKTSVGPAEPGGFAQLTSHVTHPVRFLSVGGDSYCYGWNGGVYVAPLAGGEGTRVPIRCSVDQRKNPVEYVTESKGATSIKVSPNGEEVAFVLRGDVYVTSVEHGATKRVTGTPEQERSLSWAPDGRTLYYAGERTANGSGASWNIFSSTIVHADEKHFHRATVLRESSVIATADESFQPVVSPDGKQIAFLRNRDELVVFDVTSRAVRTLVPPERNYSYSDGDIWFSWSPDSRWVAVTYLPNKSWLEQIGVVEVATGRVTDVTRSGYYESRPRWGRDGRSLHFISDRHGRRNHGSWGTDQDVIALDLTRAANDRGRLSKEDYAALTAKEDKEKKKGKKGGNDDGDAEKDEPPPTVTINFDRPERRLRRITRHSAPISSFVVSPDGEAVVYLGQVDGKWDVWISKPRAGETKKLISLGEDRGGQLELSKDGKSLFVRKGNGTIVKADVAGAFKPEKGGGRRGNDGGGGGGGGGTKTKPVGYTAEAWIDRPAERAHLFEHAWRQAKVKFYNPNLHGVDWAAMRAAYAQHLPEIDNSRDFAELLSEILGELNASHTGGRYRPRRTGGDQTASLGLLYDPQWAGDGLKIAEVLRGGPCDKEELKIAAGHTVTAVNGSALSAGANPWPVFNRLAGKLTRLTLRDAGGGSYDAVVRPIAPGAVNGLLYERLLDRRRKIVDDASGGRIGYVHVRGMNDASFRRVYRETLGLNADKEALIVDTRFNGGGWLHDDLVVFLSGKRYLDFQPRGKVRGSLGGEPLQRWDKPSCVVMSEGNYSDAHMFPWAYREHGLGKLVGAPVAGTGTAVWWERLIDQELIFGIPQVGMVDPRGEYLENQTLEPDVTVLTEPSRIGSGMDDQLLEAVRVLLDELGK